MAMLPDMWKGRGDLSPFRREMDDLFNRFFTDWDLKPTTLEKTAWAPAINVEETDDQLVITADIPGVDPKDLDISLDNNVLTIRGERKEEKEEKKKNYHRVERVYGSIGRSIMLPGTGDASKISATSKNGVVTIAMPKTAESKSKKIEVKQEK